VSGNDDLSRSELEDVLTIVERLARETYQRENNPAVAGGRNARHRIAHGQPPEAGGWEMPPERAAQALAVVAYQWADMQELDRLRGVVSSHILKALKAEDLYPPSTPTEE